MYNALYNAILNFEVNVDLAFKPFVNIPEILFIFPINLLLSTICHHLHCRSLSTAFSQRSGDITDCLYTWNGFPITWNGFPILVSWINLEPRQACQFHWLFLIFLFDITFAVIVIANLAVALFCVSFVISWQESVIMCCLKLYRAALISNSVCQINSIGNCITQGVFHMSVSRETLHFTYIC